MSIEDRDAGVIQRIGIYFRQKQEYDRACDVLERVLDVRKK
jgi:lipoprotein NlpI